MCWLPLHPGRAGTHSAKTCLAVPGTPEGLAVSLKMCARTIGLRDADMVFRDAVLVVTTNEYWGLWWCLVSGARSCASSWAVHRLKFSTGEGALVSRQMG